MIELNDLSSEILLKIFSYLPEYKDVALVCRRFYHTACILNDPEMCVEAFPRHSDDSDGFLRSILNSTRTIRKINLSFIMHSPIVVDILRKFGETINYLTIYMTNASNLIEAITLVPNVSHLSVVHFPDFFNQPPEKRARHSSAENEELNLLQLRKLNLEIIHQYEILLVFNRLPANILVELKLHHTSLPNLTELFRKQSKIKKLTIVSSNAEACPIADSNLFDHLELEYLECHATLFNCETSRSMVAKQINLKTLKLVEGETSVDLLNVITDNLTQLEVLSISVSHIPVGVISGINKLDNLKELYLQIDDEDDGVRRLCEFAMLDNRRITTFHIQYGFDIPNVCIYAMANSMPNLKVLHFHCDYNIRTFKAILNNFNYVEALHLDPFNVVFSKHKVSNRQQSLLQNRCENRKLIDLRIMYPMQYSLRYVAKMVTDYPNLKKLVIRPTNKNIDIHLLAILGGFKHMESITVLRNSHDRRLYNLTLIATYGKALKYVALSDILTYEETSSKVAASQAVRDKFGVIKYSETEGLKMAIDKRTMKMEMNAPVDL